MTHRAEHRAGELLAETTVPGGNRRHGRTGRAPETVVPKGNHRAGELFAEIVVPKGNHDPGVLGSTKSLPPNVTKISAIERETLEALALEFPGSLAYWRDERGALRIAPVEELGS